MEAHSALLVMDMQASIVKMNPISTLVPHVVQAISHARQHNIPVIFVVVSFRPGMPEVHPNNAMFSSSKQRMAGVDMEQFSKIEDPLTPLPGDIVVTKHRVSAFAGTDLELVLRSLSIQHLILTGFATSGVVLSTLREGADKDFKLTVLSDCCADADEEVQQVLMKKVFPRQAKVVELNEWIKLE